jgi:hypothetical protein
VLLLAWLFVSLPSLRPAQASAAIEVEVGTPSGKDDVEATDPMYNRAHALAVKTSVYSLHVRYVKIEGRWATNVPLPLAAGDLLTREKLFDAMEALKRAITANYLEGYGLRSKGEIGVLHIDVDYDTSKPVADDANVVPSDNTVGVIFRPYYIQVSLERVGDNVLPIPRSPQPTFFGNVPWPLLALKPTFGMSQDRSFGTAFGGAFNADLFNLKDPARISTTPDENRQLDLHAQGMKSVDESFYRVDAGLRYNERPTGELLQAFTFGGDYDAFKEPLGSTHHTRNSGAISGGVTLKLAPNTRLSLDGGYRRTDDTFKTNVPGSSTDTSANEQINRILFDAIPPSVYGFFRTAGWEENGWLNGGNSYQRIVGRLGYVKEIPVQPNQTVGLEVVLGGGTVLGTPPGYARFFGGNSPGQFLYDSPGSSTLRNIPVGPLIRSFGEGRAGLPSANGVQGGAGFWHANINLTIPIRWLSRALIPNEATDLEDAAGNPITLKQLLRKQVDVTGPSMLAAALRKEGMSSEEAQKRAGDVLAEVRPATHFIIDDANLYSIKPLLMFDAAGITNQGLTSGETWLAVGGGMEITIVVAKLQVGYMQTISGPTFGSHNNVFVRLVFQNLF